MNCLKCGSKIKDETSLYCSKCGASLQEEVVVHEQVVFEEQPVKPRSRIMNVLKTVFSFVFGVILPIVVFAYLNMALQVVYKDYKIKTALELSSAGVEDLETGEYVKGTIYKVMSKVGEFDGQTYFTVMLPSTDMTDWEALSKSYIGQAMDLIEDKLPLTNVRAEDRRVLMVATKDKELIKFFERMVYDNEHWISSKYFEGRGTYTGVFKIESWRGANIENAFEAAAIGQDETLMGFGRVGVGKENLCHYVLDVDIEAPSITQRADSYIIVFIAAILIIRYFVRWVNKFILKKNK